MILGMKYLRLKHISIISKDFPTGNNYKIKADKRLLIDANSELVIWGQLPKYLSVGLQGVCVNNKFLLCKGLLLTKTLVTIPINHAVPLKIQMKSSLFLKDQCYQIFISLTKIMTLSWIVIKHVKHNQLKL